MFVPNKNKIKSLGFNVKQKQVDEEISSKNNNNELKKHIFTLSKKLFFENNLTKEQQDYLVDMINKFVSALERKKY